MEEYNTEGRGHEEEAKWGMRTEHIFVSSPFGSSGKMWFIYIFVMLHIMITELGHNISYNIFEPSENSNQPADPL